MITGNDLPQDFMDAVCDYSEADEVADAIEAQRQRIIASNPHDPQTYQLRMVTADFRQAVVRMGTFDQIDESRMEQAGHDCVYQLLGTMPRSMFLLRPIQRPRPGIMHVVTAAGTVHNLDVFIEKAP